VFIHPNAARLEGTVADRDKCELRAQVLRAMAHPSRLMIIDELARGERCVCELQRIVGSDMSTISKHLRVMKHAGLVRDRRVGQQVYYALRVPCILRLFDCVEAVVEERQRPESASVQPLIR
jgi:ArsR family transcriptional regulator